MAEVVALSQCHIHDKFLLPRKGTGYSNQYKLERHLWRINIPDQKPQKANYHCQFCESHKNCSENSTNQVFDINFGQGSSCAQPEVVFTSIAFHCLTLTFALSLSSHCFSPTLGAPGKLNFLWALIFSRRNM